MLHALVFQRCLEGDLEPIMYMGTPVAYVRKFSDKLQIEMLRAWRPERFKTLGTQVNIAAKNDVFVLTEEQRHELMRINREYLMDPSTLPPSHNVTPQPEALALGAGREGAAPLSCADRLRTQEFYGLCD